MEKGWRDPAADPGRYKVTAAIADGQPFSLYG